MGLGNLGLILLHGYFLGSLCDPISKPYKQSDFLGSVAQNLNPRDFVRDDWQNFDVLPFKTNATYHEHEGLKTHEVPFVRAIDKVHAQDVGMGNQMCPLDIQVLWVQELGSSMYSAPLIHPLHSEDMNEKQIIASTFLSYVELLEADGAAAAGWPLAFEGRAFRAGAPAIFDVDNDGNEDLAVVDTDGNILWIQVGAYGRYLRDFQVAVPPLKVRRHWHDLVDDQVQENLIRLSMFQRDGGGDREEVAGPAPGGSRFGEPAAAASAGEGRKRAREADDLHRAPPPPQHGEALVRERLAATQRRRRDEEEGGGGRAQSFGGRGLKSIQEDGVWEQKDKPSLGLGRAGRKLLQVGEIMETDTSDLDIEAAAATATEGGAEAADGDGEEEEDGDGLGENYGDPYMYHDADDMIWSGGGTYDERGWDHYAGFGYGYEDYAAGNMNDSNYVLVDAHVLAAPTVVDLNGDGYAEIYVPVSYFYTKGSDVDPGIDPMNYVAGGIVCYDLLFQEFAWTAHLDLTTDRTAHRAYIYSSPVAADLDGDGQFELVVATGLGLVYVLDAATGACRPRFPVQVGAVEADVAVADVAGDKDLELVVADTQGNLVVLGADGRVVWDRRVTGAARAAPAVGDVDGDGQLDIVLTTTADEDGETHLWVVRGDTGADLGRFPVRLRGAGAVAAAPLLVDLHLAAAGRRATLGRGSPRAPDRLRGKDGSGEAAGGGGGGGGLVGGAGAGLHIVVPSFDGHVYIIEGSTGCTNAVDIGEHVAATVLAEDLEGDGSLDLLVVTTEGTAVALSTGVPAHPLNAWPAARRGRANGFTHGGHQGIYVLDHLTRYSNVLSQFLPITFEIVDERVNTKEEEVEAIYKVVISKGTNTLTPFLEKEYSAPGVYTELLNLETPQYATLYVAMWNDRGQYFEHAIDVAYNTQFHETLKWMILVPFFISMMPLVFFKSSKPTKGQRPLPT